MKDASTPESLLSGNLGENSKSIADGLEIRFADFEMFIDSIISDDELLRAELLSLAFHDERENFEISVSRHSPEENKSKMQAYHRALNVADTVVLCTMFSEKIPTMARKDLRYRLLEPERDVNEADTDKDVVRIAYRRARATDVAFEKFASVIPDAAAIYRDTFASVCDSVALSQADMCILPYENSEDGKLSAFYRLIESFDLKIAASCLVRSSIGEDYTRYILLSSSIKGLSEISGITDFEFSITDKNDNMLGRTLEAISLLDMSVLGIDTVRFNDEGITCDIRVSADVSAIDTLLLYLRFSMTDFSPLGLYAAFD